MPYYVIRKDTTREQLDTHIAMYGHCSMPETGVVLDYFGDAVSAQRSARGMCGAPATVLFVASPYEALEWRNREQHRFDIGHYQHVPWRADDRYPDHFAHMSTERDGLVAYTENDEKGIADRQTRVRPGRYLEQFYRDVNKATRDAWIADCAKHVATLKIARTAEEIVWVYRNGPSSCMSHDAGSYESSVHPVSVYGGSDLAVAWYGTTERVSARSVVWPAKKRYGRVYGGDGVLQRLLESAGYREAYKSGDGFSGARIRAIRESGGFVVPYIDGHDRLRQDGQWLVIDDDGGDIDAQRTEGLSVHREMAQCENCNDDYDADDDRACDGYCPSCAEDRVSCANCGDTDWSDNMVSTNAHRSLCSECASNEATNCPVCEDTFHTGDLRIAERRTRTADGTTDLCRDCARTHRPCADCGEFTDNAAHAVTGDYYCDDCTDDHVEDTSGSLPSVQVPPSAGNPATVQLREALEHPDNRWIYALPGSASCHVHNCHVALPDHAPSFYCPHYAVAYCADCIARFRRRYPHIRIPAIPVVTDSAEVETETETEVAEHVA